MEDIERWVASTTQALLNFRKDRSGELRVPPLPNTISREHIIEYVQNLPEPKHFRTTLDERLSRNPLGRASEMDWEIPRNGEEPRIGLDNGSLWQILVFQSQRERVLLMIYKLEFRFDDVFVALMNCTRDEIVQAEYAATFLLWERMLMSPVNQDEFFYEDVANVFIHWLYTNADDRDEEEETETFDMLLRR